MSVTAPPAVHELDGDTVPEEELDDVLEEEGPRVCHLLDDAGALCGAGHAFGVRVPDDPDFDPQASPCASGCGLERCTACVEASGEL